MLVHSIGILTAWCLWGLFLQVQSRSFISIITRKCGFSKGQLDRSVHINPGVCPFWLRVWDMKNMCYIWPIHLTKCQVEDLVKMEKCPSKWPWLNQITILNEYCLLKLTILIEPLVKLMIMIWDLVKWTIFIWWLSLFVKPRLLKPKPLLFETNITSRLS